MTDIRAKIDAALAAAFEHYYNGFPEFPEGGEPSEYAAYFISEKPTNFASGRYTAKSYWISVSIITNGYNQELYDRAEAAFEAEGFTYADGTDVSGYETTSPSPHRYRYSQEYLISVDR